jgi:hypothetical protein
MKGFEFETLESPVFLAGAAVSVGVLIALRIYEKEACDADRRMRDKYVNGNGRWHPSVRIRLEEHPLLKHGRPNTARFFNPGFLLGEVMAREPMAIIPVSLGWMALLLGSSEFATYCIAFGLCWRVFIDVVIEFADLPWGRRMGAVFLKTLWVAATGIGIATVAYLLLAALVALMIFLALIGSGMGQRNRRR